jgi:hypothetical protein
MILRSWKQIADYLSTSVRSAQRCEAVHGMPVHRGAGSPRSSVFALTREIDEWLESVPVKQKPVEITAASPRVRSGSARLSTILAVDDNDVHLYALHKVRFRPQSALHIFCAKRSITPTARSRTSCKWRTQTSDNSSRAPVSISATAGTYRSARASSSAAC